MSRISLHTMALVTLTGLVAHPAVSAGQAAGRWTPSLSFTANTALGRPQRNWGPGGSVALLRQSGRFSVGLEAGYLGFGTEVTQIENFDNQPGAVLREETSRSMILVAALLRFEGGAGSVRPYLIGGAGGYDGRFRDRIEVHDPAGNRIPAYDFVGSGSDVKPGLTGGLGLRVGRPGRGLVFGFEARWHGIIDLTEDGLGTANHLSVGVVLSR